MKRCGARVASMLLLALGTASSAMADQGDRERPWRVLHFFERGAGDLAFLDLGAPGPSIGDRLVFSNPLYDSAGPLQEAEITGWLYR